MDIEIERATNLKIKDFFKTYGENEFRKIEKSIFMTAFLKNKNTVFSPGAGIFSGKELQNVILNQSICIFLNARISF